MAKADLIEMDGVITNVARGVYLVKCPDDLIVQAQLAGKLKRFKIRVMLGDRVKVNVSPYDLKRGFITYRMR
jgi:translation initiation factor IF-1